MKLILLMVFGIGIVSVLMMSDTIYADEGNSLVLAFHVFVEGQLKLIQQNNALIQQNHVIIELLKSDRNIFVAGVTDRYIPMEWLRPGMYECFDRLQFIVVQHSCGLANNMTKDQFSSMMTGNPEN